MNKQIIKLIIFVVLCIVFAFTNSEVVQAETQDPLVGNWIGFWQTSEWPTYGLAGNFRFEIISDGSNYATIMYIPDFGVLFEELPVEIYGDTIFLGPIINGTLSGNTIEGDLLLPPFGQILWQAHKVIAQDTSIGTGPGPECNDLPKLYCTGSAEYCSELIPFDPDSGIGYIDYPVNGETSENQYRSYIRRDLKQLIDYATAKLQCKTANWNFGSSAPLGLADMSEADGSIPGTSIGSPGHPPGTHTDGKDIDVAYYQYYFPDNYPRWVCDHHVWDSTSISYAYHCTSDPYQLDPWRTALFTAFLAEHPFLRVMGVDGKIGPPLEDSLDWFASNYWIDPDLRSDIPLIYEETDQGYGFYLHHHHHMHVSMNPVEPILQSLQFEPETININNSGKYITAYIELVDGYDPSQIDLGTIFITVDGFSTLSVNPDFFETGDFDEDGIPDLMVKFDRQALQSILSAGTQEITLYGAIDGTIFQGAGLIKVLSHDNKGK